jgi:hypothetical protein
MTVVAAAIVLVAPLAAATPEFTFSPPYTGAPEVSTSTSTQGCAATARFAPFPTFSTSTGVGKVSAKTTAKACADGSGLDSSQATAILGYLGSCFTQPTRGTHDVIATWSVNFNISVSAKSGGVGQLATAEAHFFANVQIFNASTDATCAGGAPLAFNHNTTLTGLTKSPGSGHLTGTGFSFQAQILAVPLGAGDSYFIQTQFELVLLTEVSASGSSSASASGNIGTSGNQLTQQSVKIV